MNLKELRIQLSSMQIYIGQLQKILGPEVTNAMIFWWGRMLYGHPITSGNDKKWRIFNGYDIICFHYIKVRKMDWGIYLKKSIPAVRWLRKQLPKYPKLHLGLNKKKNLILVDDYDWKNPRFFVLPDESLKLSPKRDKLTIVYPIGNSIQKTVSLIESIKTVCVLKAGS